MSDSLISAEVMKAHRARWFVYVGDGSPEYPREMIPHTAMMRGQWGYDVKCSCGEFETRTGGAVKRAVEDELFAHRWSAQCDAERAAEAAAPGKAA